MNRRLAILSVCFLTLPLLTFAVPGFNSHSQSFQLKVE
jgi:hypothetical protein